MKLKVKTCVLLACLSTVISACRASGIDVTIQNNSSVPLRNVEIDYPGAAFGAGTIAPGSSYWYHIKPLGDGEITVSFEQANGGSIQQKGPRVRAGDREILVLVVTQDSNKQWHVSAQH